MSQFSGTLNHNEVLKSLYNMIISQNFVDNVNDNYGALVDSAKVDGSMYGDTKIVMSADVLPVHDWLGDEEAANLLALDRPADPKAQAITLDVFKQVRMTVDSYLSKRAFSDPGTFQQFYDLMKGRINKAKRLYDITTFNAFIGTTETAIGAQTEDITPIDGQNDALTMAQALADLLVELKDVSREFNDYGHVTLFNENDLVIVWNSKHYNSLKKVDMPQIFHNEGLLTEFKQEVLPSRYFGKKGEGSTTGDGETIRSLVGQAIGGKYYMAGDLIDQGVIVPEGTWYTEDDTIAFKIMHKDSVPYMSAFSVSTNFLNPRSLTENNYLTFGHNTLQYIEGLPFITRRFKEA